MEVIKINKNDPIKNKQFQVTNAPSTGGLGIHFENDVQTAFVILMLANGFSPCLPSWSITKILLQGGYLGYRTDDLIVFCGKPNSNEQTKLIAQIKHTIEITNNDEFQKVIKNAWSDFNNPRIFTANSMDKLALICGPLSATDTNDVRAILEHARMAIDSKDFFYRIEKPYFISDQKRFKLNVFKEQLKKANNDIDLTDSELWQFLKSYYLLIYDLDIKGVTLSIFQTLIDQFCPCKSDEIWNSVNRCVQTTCNNAGYIDISRIPDEVVNYFKKRQIERIPEDFIQKPSRSLIDLDKTPELLTANLLGSWDDENDFDKMIVSNLALKDYSVWIGSLQKIVNHQHSPVQYKNRIWSIPDREFLWKNMLLQIFDEKLDLYQKLAINVLSEKDPKFDLPAEDRLTSNIFGKKLTFSYQLRSGIAETLALLTSFNDYLENCTSQKGASVSTFVVRELLFNADWTVWASLDSQLPLLAESSPDMFLAAVKNGLMRDPCPFDALFQQEGKEITGCNYITGLLWAIEELAWEEDYFGLSIDILSNLANRDPGGTWANRPINSMTTIFLPWLPQTTVSIERRKTAIQSLEEKFPEIAWTLILSLLPQHNQISMGSHRFKWRKSGSSINERVSDQIYREQVAIYADMAVDMAKNKIKRLQELIDRFDNLPLLALNKMIEYLSSDEIEILTVEEKATLWKSLTTCLINFKQNTDEEEVSNSSIYLQIEQITKKIEPEDPIKQNTYLFVENETELYEKFDDFEAQGKLIKKKRQDALRLIIEKKGINELLGMIKTVDSPSVLGNTLSGIADQAIDNMILPAYLAMDDRDYELFTSSYVWKKYFELGWNGIDLIDKTSWSADQIVKFYLYLPFCSEAWKRIESEAGEIESFYWNKVPARLYKEDHPEYAIDKFIEYNRPYEAIACLCRDIYNKKPLDIPRSVVALKLVIKTTDPNVQHTDTLHLKELIRTLQEHMNEVDPNDMLHIEWYFMPYMSHTHGLIPKYLNKLLAQDPYFFMEIINIAFKPKSKLGQEEEMTEKEQAIALNAWRLLEQWHTPPGLKDNNEFDCEILKSWINTVREESTKSERYEMAMNHIGQALYYAPPDPSGFFINISAAEELNKDDIDEMRNGFYFAEMNSRGVHWVDPTGKQEKDLAEQYREKAKDADNSGFCLFAQTLRNIAKHYDREADENSNRFG